MYLIGTEEYIKDTLAVLQPQSEVAVLRARRGTQRCKGEIYDYQAMALYALARQHQGYVPFLEIGSAYGFSAAVLAQGAPDAHITSLNVQDHEVKKAREDLSAMGLIFQETRHAEPKTVGVELILEASTEYLHYEGHPKFRLIFVDGDHANVHLDFPWWQHLAIGGLFLFHDYSPADSGRPCPPVYNALNIQRNKMDRDFDVAIIDENHVGMVGYYRYDSDDDTIWCDIDSW